MFILFLYLDAMKRAGVNPPKIYYDSSIYDTQDHLMSTKTTSKNPKSLIETSTEAKG